MAKKKIVPRPAPLYSIHSVISDEFHLGKFPAELQAANLVYNVNFEFGFDTQEKRVAARFQYQMGQENSPFLEMSAIVIFNLENYDEIVLATGRGKKKKMELPIDFARTLLVITIGTSRGILHARTEGSNLNKYPMPIMDVMQLLPDPDPA